ncbi:MAG: type I-E CRISPR-associated endoribonuclease Cas2 [Chloroflexi bacterium]|nr:type I-E CRISPR-associated endoribonuclease Cas2 [Chloroflexota bacterium]
MIVMILERMTPALRGELTRWLVEPHTNVFVGNVNAMVRERLWQKCCKLTGSKGGVVQIWSTNTEQRFAMRLHGETQRNIVELDGIQLVRIPDPPAKVQKKLKAVARRAAQVEIPPPDMPEKG